MKNIFKFLKKKRLCILLVLNIFLILWLIISPLFIGGDLKPYINEANKQSAEAEKQRKLAENYYNDSEYWKSEKEKIQKELEKAKTDPYMYAILQNQYGDLNDDYMDYNLNFYEANEDYYYALTDYHDSLNTLKDTMIKTINAPFFTFDILYDFKDKKFGGGFSFYKPFNNIIIGGGVGYFDDSFYIKGSIGGRF